MTYGNRSTGAWPGLLLGLAGCLGLLSGASAQQTQQADPGSESSGFKYSDDWTIVSAPPPPGPYYSVNVDPRVPGQEDNVPLSPADYDTGNEREDQMINTFMSAPPSAGRPAVQAAPPAGSTAYSLPYNSYRQRPSDRPYAYPQRGPAPYYEYSRDPGYAGRYYPPAAPPARASVMPGPEAEVPAPPVYDRMLRTTPPGPYGYRGGGYQ
jgi:hypothetical protein